MHCFQSSTPLIMEIPPQLSTAGTSCSYRSQYHSHSSAKNDCCSGKSCNNPNVTNVSDDESLDTPRIIPPTTADSDHTISSTSRDDLCHQRYQQHQYRSDIPVRYPHNAAADNHREFERHANTSLDNRGREFNNQHCVTSSQLLVPQKQLPFRSLSELSARISNSDVTTITDDENEESFSRKRNNHDDVDICVDDDVNEVVEYDSRSAKRRRTDHSEIRGEVHANNVETKSRRRSNSSATIQQNSEDLHVVSDASLPESDEGYSSVRYPPSSQIDYTPVRYSVSSQEDASSVQCPRTSANDASPVVIPSSDGEDCNVASARSGRRLEYYFVVSIHFG